ncbi:MAG: hypothetical protein HYR94_19035 [Chloroflexi bacterium]|nr:hypothetical protein [Chloroflexota bacterium]
MIQIFRNIFLGLAQILRSIFLSKTNGPLILDNNIKDLYIGYFGENDGDVASIGSDHTAFDEFRGEVLFRSANQDNSIVVKRLDRLALFGPLPGDSDPYLKGVFSLAGPLTEPNLQSDPSGGSIENLSLTIHYEALPIRRDEGSHTWVPEVEIMDAKLSWQQEVIAANTLKWQNVTLIASLNQESRKLGAIESIELALPQIIFHQVGVEEPRGEPHNSLSSHCGSPNPTCSPTFPGGSSGGSSDVERRLPVKFINLTFNPGTPSTLGTTGTPPTLGTTADAERTCNKLNGGVKTVWRNQLALDLTVWPNRELYPNDPSPPVIVDGLVDNDAPIADRIKYSQIDYTREHELKRFRESARNPPPGDWGHVEIYLVNALDDQVYKGGGVTVETGQASAFCILQSNKADSNPNLLAHELGHVLGLDDNPPKSTGLVAGSAGSIMANSRLNVNTMFHRNVLYSSPPINATINPILKNTLVADCCKPCDLYPPCP